jgi:molybdopterin-guanine dinucleotide biosynthesis protein MobB
MGRGGFNAPVLACCGFSGSGKTSLLEAVVPKLRARGLDVAVVKHDAHGIRIDREGKDSDRLFRAGANVILRGPDETAARWHGNRGPDLDRALDDLGATHDLVLVEGHKQTALPKLWLLGEDDEAPPGDVTDVLEVLPRGDERSGRALEVIDRFVRDAWMDRPIRAGILVGGRSSRMGSPKQLLEIEGAPLMDRVLTGLGPSFSEAVFLGAGQVPSSVAGLRWVPDAPGLAGPLAGFLAAMRWDPEAVWLMVACDQPSIRPDAVEWLLGERRPGRWAVMPRLEGGPVEPFLAVYEPQARGLIEGLARSGNLGPWRLAEHSKVADPRPPDELSACWRNVNTSDDLAALSD